MNAYTVLIVDDQALIREGLRTILDMEDDLQVVGMAKNGLEAYEKTGQLRPSLVMMDIQMPVMDGLDSIKLIKNSYPDTIILILTTFVKDDYIIDGLTNGASGYLLKDMDGDKMLSGIRDALAGQFILPAIVAAKLAARLAYVQSAATAETGFDVATYRGTPLTEREKEIAGLIVKGASNRQIAAGLFISEGTVRNYVSIIYSKLGVSERAQAIIRLQGHL